jgi:hypothetical protein
LVPAVVSIQDIGRVAAQAFIAGAAVFGKSVYAVGTRRSLRHDNFVL